VADLRRYSDKYRPTAVAQPSLKRKDLNAAFFPPEIFEGYFNPKKKRKGAAPLPIFIWSPAHAAYGSSGEEERQGNQGEF
jgi:hypothetical protein